MNLDQQSLPRLTAFQPAFIRSIVALFGFIFAILCADPAQAAINIMPLGDSITQGGKSSIGSTYYASYRYALYFKLKNAGYAVNMVGSLNVTSPTTPTPSAANYPNYSTTFDRDHEGHWGKTTLYLDQNINTWLAGLSATDKPDLVVLNIGTNDANNISTATYTSQLNSVIDKLRASNANITIILSNIMVFINHETACASFNTAISGVVTSKNTPASRVVLADINSNLPANARYDGIHPNLVGEEHLATVYFNAIKSVLDPEAITVDNAQTADVFLTGSWFASTASPGYYGTNYHHDNNIDKGTKSFAFLPTLPADGDCLVFARWVATPNRATNVPIDIVTTSGTSTVTVNQQLNGSTWNLLGYYNFSAATAEITIRTTGTNGYVIADAVSLLPAVGTTVDNTDAAVTIVGTWSPSTGTPGYLGTNYVHDGNTGKGTKSFSFKPALPATDSYLVYARWPAEINRATNVPVDIVTSNGSVSTVTVNQQTNSNSWNLLGTYTLAPANAEVKFRTNGTNGYVVADGVRVIPVPVQ
ncbi:MAG: SGNH/GDSL hydrolase family protein [Chthoniobacterales bacterium]